MVAVEAESLISVVSLCQYGWRVLLTCWLTIPSRPNCRTLIGLVVLAFVKERMVMVSSAG